MSDAGETGENWVRARAECTLEDNFNAISKAIKNDVEKYNHLASGKRRDRLFLPQKNGEKELRVFRAVRDTTCREVHKLVKHDDYRDDFVCVQLSQPESIIASRQNIWHREIIPRWNEETLSCDLFVEDKCYPL